MKSFMIAALLVAAVAGQSTMDLLKLNKEKALLNKFDRPITSDYLLKKLGYPLDRVYGENVEVEFPYHHQEEVYDREILGLEEIVSHPLFREYMSLPYFRQFWTYPAFQKYVTSVYFQKFWHIPTFKTYFVNPVLFYKYIYPIVNLFKTDITLPNQYYGEEQIVNKNVFPFVADFDRDLVKDNKYFVPTFHNQELRTKDDLYVKHLLVKIYSHLYEIPEELVREHFFANKNIVDPITGEIKYINDKYTTYPIDQYKYTTDRYNSYPVDMFNQYKYTYPVDQYKYTTDRYNSYPVDQYKYTTGYPVDTTFDYTSTYGDKLVKDVLLKKMLHNRFTHGEETYKHIPTKDVLLREKMMKMNPIVNRIMETTFKPTYFNKFDKMNRYDINMKDLIQA